MTTWSETHARNDDPWTSKAAAELTPSKESMLKRLGAAYEAVWPNGMTAEEASIYTGFEYYATSKRISDLLIAKVLVETGRTKAGSSGRQQRVHVWNGRHEE